MKLIQSSSILVVDPDEPARTQATAGLQALGLERVCAVGSLAEARGLVIRQPFDVCVLAIEATPPDEPVASPPFRMPTVLLSGPLSRAQARLLLAAGFAAVLPRPVPARLIYRRIGSVLQRARRLGRRTLPGPAGAPVAFDIAAEAKE